MSETYETGTGQLLQVHAREDCSGRCPIHAPSNHSLRTVPTHWRDDRGLMERICEHGIGHPDPDDLYFRVTHGEGVEGAGVHGCDGCCREAGRDERR